MIERADWRTHPFSERFSNQPAWYVLLVPTSWEGHQVKADLERAMAGQKADFSVLIGFLSNDPTASYIWEAAESDARIVPVPCAVDKPRWDVMKGDFDQALETLKAQRKREPTDVLLVSFPELIIHRSA